MWIKVFNNEPYAERGLSTEATQGPTVEATQGPTVEARLFSKKHVC